MVAIEGCIADCQHCFILRPNRSLTWRQNVWVFGFFCLVTLAIALPLAAMGFWLVLPFAGLELLAVGTGLYLVTCRCHEREVICIAADSIRIERGRLRPQQRWVLSRTWARVELQGCPRHWYPSRLLIRAHHRTVEIGRFLAEEERHQLARELNARLSDAPVG
jgi:uncharacterized membrane protein